MESISTTSCEEKEAAEQKARGLKRMADCLRQAEGIEINHDIDKLNDLKETRKRQKLEALAMTKQIKLEEKKKKRLLNKVQTLPTNDLLEAARIRFMAADAKAKVQSARESRGDVGDPSPTEEAKDDTQE